jgi:hypothetical protein
LRLQAGLPVSDGQRVFGSKGKVIVAEASPVYKELGRTDLGDQVITSPDFAEGRLYLRAKQTLCCIGAKK